MTTFIFQHQADTEKGFQVREQVCETPKEGETFSTKKPSSSIVSQAAEFNFRNQLKTVKKKEFSMDEEEGAGVSLCYCYDEDGDALSRWWNFNLDVCQFLARSESIKWQKTSKFRDPEHLLSPGSKGVGY